MDRNLEIIRSPLSDFPHGDPRPREMRRCILRSNFQVLPLSFWPSRSPKSLAMRSSAFGNCVPYLLGKALHQAGSPISHTSYIPPEALNLIGFTFLQAGEIIQTYLSMGTKDHFTLSLIQSRPSTVPLSECNLHMAPLGFWCLSHEGCENVWLKTAADVTCPVSNISYIRPIPPLPTGWIEEQNKGFDQFY